MTTATTVTLFVKDGQHEPVRYVTLAAFSAMLQVHFESKRQGVTVEYNSFDDKAAVLKVAKTNLRAHVKRFETNASALNYSNLQQFMLIYQACEKTSVSRY